MEAQKRIIQDSFDGAANSFEPELDNSQCRRKSHVVI